MQYHYWFWTLVSIGIAGGFYVFFELLWAMEEYLDERKAARNDRR